MNHPGSVFPGPATAFHICLPGLLLRRIFQQAAGILAEVEAAQQGSDSSRQQMAAVKQHSFQAGFKVLHGAGGQQGLGVQGGLQQGDGFALLLLRLTVGG